MKTISCDAEKVVTTVERIAEFLAARTKVEFLMRTKVRMSGVLSQFAMLFHVMVYKQWDTFILSIKGKGKDN
jgi:hypothetical protein